LSFTPTYDENTVKKYIGYYQKNPDAFSQEQAVMLRDHAEAYDMTFALTDEHHDSSIGSVLKQAGIGYVEGFTTYRQTDNAPGDQWERLGRRIGNLAGFMGLIPPIGKVFKGPLAQGISKMSGKSIPLVAADKATEWIAPKAAKFIKASGGGEEATSAAMRFFTGEKAANLAAGAFRLGTASAVSSWQGGVDEMMSSFYSGAKMGASFRGIGMMNFAGDPTANKVIRSLAASAFIGLPSTVRGETTPEQVYSYIEGAFFGWGERTAAENAAASFMKKANERINSTPSGERSSLYEPEKHEGWTGLSAEARSIVKNEFDNSLRSIEAVIQRLKDEGILSEDGVDAMRERVGFSGTEYEEYFRPLEEKEIDEIRRVDEEFSQDTADNTSEYTGGGRNLEDIKINRNIEQLVDFKFGDIIEDKNKLQAKIDLSAEENRLIEENNPNAAEEFVSYVSKYFGGVSLDEPTRGGIRQRVRQRMNQYDMRFVTVDMTDEGNTINMIRNGQVDSGGNQSVMRVDRPVIVDAYERAMGRNGQPADKEALAILDHITNNLGKKIELDSLDSDLAKKAKAIKMKEYNEMAEQFGPENARYDYEGEKELAARLRRKIDSDVLSSMRERGYHYFGGRGDATRMYFVRYHPEVPNSIKEVRDVLRHLDSVFEYTPEELEVESIARDDFIAINKGSSLTSADEYYDFTRLSNILYDLELNGFEGLAKAKELTQGNFIKDPKAWNKRQQIWFTSGWRLDPNFSLYKGIHDLVDGRRLNVEFREDFNPKIDGEIGPNALRYTQATDGSLIIRSDVLKAMLEDMGVYSGGNVGKSFIVEPDSELGALLGKYAMHIADPVTDARMFENGTHAIMYRTSAKQMGKRGAEFTVDVSSFFGVPSEITDSHSIAKQRIAKQLITNLSEFVKNPLDSKTISGMIDWIINRGMNGTLEGQATGSSILGKLSKSEQFTADDVAEFSRNIDDIPLVELFNIVRHNDSNVLADAFYRHVLRVESEDVRDAREDGEATDFEVAEVDNSMLQYQSIFKTIAEVSDKGTPIWQHKFLKGYTEKAVLNYVVKRVVRPKIENSGVFRLTQYTPEMAHLPNTKILNERNDVFLLHDNHRDIEIYSNLFANKKNMMTLGEIWDNIDFTDGTIKAKGGLFKDNISKIEELLRAVIVRVPMGSISGAHVLKFGGFTGIKGFGGITHGETTMAIGGADLDGDKAFYFFGDSSHGFKPEWKDMYASNRDEFLVQDAASVKTRMPDLKKDFAQELSNPNEMHKKFMGNRASMYSPYVRSLVSAASYNGRSALKNAVTARSVALSAHSTLANMNKPYLLGVTSFKYLNGEKGEGEVYLLPRLMADEIALFHKFSRAAIELTADPMDEPGLLNGYRIAKKIEAKLFKWVDSGGIEIDPDKIYDNGSGSVRNKFLNMFSNVNSALYSRNHQDGRRWMYEEIQMLLSDINKEIPVGAGTTLYPRLARAMHGLDWRDSILNRVDVDGIMNLSREANKIYKSGKFDYLKGLFRRGTVGVRFDHVEAFLRLKLHTQAGWDAQLNEKTLDANLYQKLFAGDKNREYWRGTRPGEPEWQRKRVKMMAIAKSKIEDFITNDIADMATLLHVHEYVQRIKASDPDNWEKRVVAIREQVSRLRGSIKKEQDAFRLEQEKSIEETGEKIASTIRKTNMDFIIKSAKEKIALSLVRNGLREEPELTLDEHRLFDALVLGTWDVGTNRFDAVRKAVTGSGGISSKDLYSLMEMSDPNKKIKNLTEDEAFSIIQSVQDSIGEYVSDVKSTRYLRFGFDSNIVAKSSIKKHIKLWSSFLEKYKEKPRKLEEAVKPELRKPLKALREKKQVSQFLTDENGNRTVVKLLDLEEVDPIERKYREDRKPFEVGENLEEYPELTKEYTKLVEHLNFYPNLKSTLHLVVRDLFEKDLNAMRIEDLKALNRFFESARKGSLFSRIYEMISGDKEYSALKKWFWNVFPESINRHQMKTSIETMLRRGIFYDKDGVKIVGDVMVPTGAIGILQNNMGYIEEMKTRTYERISNDINDELYPYVHGIAEGPSIFSFAIARMEWEGLRTSGVKSSEGDYKSLRERYEQELEIINQESLLSKIYTINDKPMSGDEVAREIEKSITRRMDEAHSWLIGNPEFIKQFIEVDENGAFMYHGKVTGIDTNFKVNIEYKNGDVDLTSLPKFNIKKIMKYLNDKKNADTHIPLEIGLRNLELIRRSVLAQELLDSKQFQAYNELVEKDIKGVGYRKGYFPHIMFSNKEKAIFLYNERIKEILERDANGMEEEKLFYNELKGVIHSMRSMTGDVLLELPSQAYYDRFDDMMARYKGDPKRDTLKWDGSDHRVGSMESRDMFLDGWEISPAVVDNYMARIVNSFYRSVAEIQSRHVIKEVQSRNELIMPKSVANAWSNFFKLYVNNSLGYPAILPDALARDPNMKVNGTPYAWFNDLSTKRRLNKIVKALNLDKSTHESIKNLAGYEAVDYKTVMWLANMEARYQMASLLAHPKTAVANIFGGETNTVISAGLTNLLRAIDIKYLRMINPEWRSMNDVEKFVIEHGIIEEYLLKEAQFNPAFKSDKHKKFFADLSAYLKKNPNANSKSLMELAKKHGVWDSIFEKAAWFMRVSERRVRRDSFMAHYIQAREKWGDTLPYDSPILIEIAKRGVRATQFMYSNTYRPMFAQTALGKVMTRFQAYAWNSVKMRNDIIRQAGIYGFKEGTQEFARFKRLFLIDSMMLMLSSVFMYSIFDNNLPQPYSWIQDLANWMFGNEEERDKAFFGSYPTVIAPLQAVTPPMLRMIGPLSKAITTGNWDKIANYHVWMMFPFGRIGKDFLGKNNLFENPYQLNEKMLGVPFLRFSKDLTVTQKQDLETVFEYDNRVSGYDTEQARKDREEKKIKSKEDKKDRKEKFKKMREEGE